MLRILGWHGRTLDPDRPLRELGIDSLAAVELRNALAALVGMRLPATLVFDHPDARAIARFVLGGLDLGAEDSDGAAPLPALPPRRAVPEGAAQQGIAVLSMACRFPGGVTTPEALWTLLCEGRDAITEVPPDRWDASALYSADRSVPGTVYTRWGGFVDHVDRFDAAFFGISPKEAAAMDPQQRLLLEVCWEALERAGRAPQGLRGSRTGVFVGVCLSEYAQLSMAQPERITPYTGSGTSASVVAGRVAYTLGLQGPTMSVDTACSSSLVALQLAVRALQAGDCDLALVGGVNLQLAAETTIAFCRMESLSPTGRCRAFGAQADGYVRGDGCGVVVLSRLSDADAHADPVIAVVRGAAVNHDGRSNGLTAPNGPSQEAVVRRALELAGVQPAQVGYVEAHGTGTPLGDPIEALALAAVHAERPADQPLRLGSVKSNIGHTEGAAGIAGFMKLVLALQHGQIPASLHASTLNPHVPW
ncbi:MAG: type I polyketide synthase [Myxococcales bacterium]|nr:type I polyketide synthase [Myxococcales bacterium]